MSALDTSLLGADLEAEVLGRDTRVRVRDTLTAPFCSICHLDHSPPTGEAWIGTGTLVGPRTVLTAAHNLLGAAPGDLRVTPGRDGVRAPFGTAVASAFLYWHRGYSEADERTVRDLAIVRLASPLPRADVWTAAPTRSRTDTTGRSISGEPLPVRAGVLSVNLSGYPVDKCGSASAPLRCGSTQWRSYNSTVRIAAGLLHHLNDTKPGHSGSPVWVRRHPSRGGRVLVGVHVARHDVQGRTVSNTAVRLTPAMVRWIVANTR